MGIQSQYQICLIRLVLPADNFIQKVTLSVQSLSFQYFIQKERIVRDHKVNFYREQLFLPSLHHDIFFHIYSSQSVRDKRLLKTLSINQQQLANAQKRTQLYCTLEDGYELVWQCGVFQESEQEGNYETDRDYTELIMNSEFLGEDFENSSQNGESGKPKLIRRSTSASSIQAFQDLTEVSLKTSSAKSKLQGNQKSRDDFDLAGKGRGGLQKLFSYFNLRFMSLFQVSGG